VVGRTRVGCDAARWQGETRRRADARNEEQRRKQAAARLNRVCSALPQQVTYYVGTNLDILQGLPAEQSGQLPFLGLSLGGVQEQVRHRLISQGQVDGEQVRRAGFPRALFGLTTQRQQVLAHPRHALLQALVLVFYF
jgi:hypothetical protein